MTQERLRSEPHEQLEPLHYRIEGTGPHVALLHPVGLDLTCFDGIAARLSQRFTVLRMDLRGHGRSLSSPPARRLEDYADDIHALLQHLNFAPAGIVGFSFGGMLAQVLGLTHPADASALVIAACASTLSDEARRTLAERGARAQREGMTALLESTVTRWFSKEFRARGADQPIRKQLLAVNVDAWAQAWYAMADVHTAPRLREIRVPTLCLAGEADVSAPPHTVEVIARSITGARFQVVPGAPHMLFLEQPSVVSGIISGFLTEVLGGDGVSGRQQ